MEAVAFEVRTNVEVMKESGVEVGELRLSGSAADSMLWN